MTAQEVVLTGITTTGAPHLGNYVGAIRPALEAGGREGVETFYFLADYHALVKCKEAEKVRRSRLEVAAAWLALGMDVERSCFYRQSDIPEVHELAWILATLTAKGLMNRAHAYKAWVQENIDAGEDPDRGIEMGLFSYPILQAADIMLFKATHVPVGRDQVQHIEMTRDLALRFNHLYGDLLVPPLAVVPPEQAVLVGLDGRKMSKSYGNTLELFAEAKVLRKSIMRLKTNSQPAEEPKEWRDDTLFSLYSAFAAADQVEAMRRRYETGIGWGEVKGELADLLEENLAEPRRLWNDWRQRPADVEEVLRRGAEKARARARPYLQEIRRAVGVS